MKSISLPFIFLGALFLSLPLSAVIEEGKEDNRITSEKKALDHTKETQTEDLIEARSEAPIPFGMSATGVQVISVELSREEQESEPTMNNKITSSVSSPPLFMEGDRTPSLGKKENLQTQEEERRQALLAEIRARRIQTPPATLGPITKKITGVHFEDGPIEEGKSSQSLKTLQKNKSPKSESDKEFKKNARAFKKIISDLEIAVEENHDLTQKNNQQSEQVLNTATPSIKSALEKLVPLTVGSSSKLNKVVAIYKEALPEVKEHLQALLESMTAETTQVLDQIQEQASESDLVQTTQLVEKHFFLSTFKAEAESDQLAKEYPEKSSKVAAIYMQAYQELKPRFEFLLATVQKNPEFVDQEVALSLARSAIQLVEVAFKTIDREKMRPIKIQEGMSDDILNARKIPQEAVPYEQLKEEDDEAGYVIYEAHNTAVHLADLIVVLNSSDAQPGRFLRTTQYLKASAIANIAMKKKSIAGRKVFFLSQTTQNSSEKLIAARAVLNLADRYFEQCNADYKKLIETPPLADPVEVRIVAIKEVLDIASSILKISDQLISAFISKSN